MILGMRSMAFIPVGCYAFHQRQPLVSSPSPLTLRTHAILSTCGPTRIYSSTSSGADQSLYGIDFQDDDDARGIIEGGDCNSGLELWVDLRGTSLTPKAAFDLWDLEEGQDSVDRQPDDELDMDASQRAPFAKCLVSSKSKGESDNNSLQSYPIDKNIEVLIVEESNGDGGFVSTIQRVQHSMPAAAFGRILSLETSSSMPVLPDPLPAMEVASKGQWVILDTDGWKKIDEEDRLSMVLPLVELISSGSAGGGGIGLTCSTKNEVVKAAMFIQTMMNNASGGCGGNTRTITLDSGIVIPDDTESTASDAGMPQVAIVVPYDMELLRIAKLLFADKES